MPPLARWKFGNSEQFFFVTSGFGNRPEFTLLPKLAPADRKSYAEFALRFRRHFPQNPNMLFKTRSAAVYGIEAYLEVNLSVGDRSFVCTFSVFGREV
jgi:hypothetical protein